jgi:uncharacterized protein (TIGR00369 family)
MAERTPIHASRFISGAKPGGFGVQYYLNPDGTLSANLTISIEKEGPPGHAHGGSLATLLDEAMGACCWAHEHRVLAANLNINYKQPVPLETEIVVIGRVERQEGRKLYTSGIISLLDGTICVEGSGIFIEAPHIFDRFGAGNPFKDNGWNSEGK